MIEATITHLITATLGDERITPSIELLPLSNTQAGKIAIAKQLGVLSSGQYKFIRKYSELRNDLVHNIENIEFSFTDYWANLDSNQKGAWKDAIDWGGKTKEPNKALRNLMEKKPKISLWLSILTLVGICETHASEASMHRKLNTAAERTTKEHIKKQDELIEIQSKLIEAQAAIIEASGADQAE